MSHSDTTAPHGLPSEAGTSSLARPRQQATQKQRRQPARRKPSPTATTLGACESVGYHPISLPKDDRRGDAAVAAHIRQSLHAYALTGLPSDWISLRSLFFSACACLPGEVIRHIRDELVEMLLQQDPPRLEAVELLCKLSNGNAEHDRYELQKYLMYYCTKHADETLQASEARKLFKGLRLCSVLPDAEFLRPIVQTAVNKGKPEIAHDLLQTLSAEMALPLSLPMVTDIIRGYGRQLNWTRIDELVTWLHDQDLSRKKPRAFAAVVRHAFNLFACYNPSTEETYDFLTYCLQSCGMVPTLKLSNDVLSLFVRRRRYDLLHRWMKDRQTHFPGLVNPARAHATAHDIATAWAARSTRHISISDILATCQALARGAVRNEFSDEFRYVTKEVIEADISARCTKLCWAVGSAATLTKLPVPKNFKSFEDLDCYASEIISYADYDKGTHVLRRMSRSTGHETQVSLLRPARHSTRVSLLRSELMRQLAAARETHLLLHDFDAYLKIYGPPALDVGVLEQSESVAEPQEDKMISTFSEQWRYQSQTTAEILHHINAVYQDLEAKGESIRRVVFFTAFIALTNIERYRSVLALLHELYISRWSDRVFNRQILSLWVRTAMVVSNPLALREALWAVVDSPSSIDLPARFLVLVRLAQEDLIYYHGSGWRRMTQEQHDEIEYLKKRIYRRKWYQMGCPGAEDIEEPNLREWARELTHETFEPMNKKIAADTEERASKEPKDSVDSQPHALDKNMVSAGDHHMQLLTTSQTKAIDGAAAEGHTAAGSVNRAVGSQPAPLNDVYSVGNQNAAAEGVLSDKLAETMVHQPFTPWENVPPIGDEATTIVGQHTAMHPAGSIVHQPSLTLQDIHFTKGHKWPSSTDARIEIALGPGGRKKREIRRLSLPGHKV